MDDKRDPVMGDGRWEEGSLALCGVAVATRFFGLAWAKLRLTLQYWKPLR